MARIIHSNNNDIIDNIWQSAKDKGIMHINSEEQEFDGTKFKIKGKELINFGTCGYLGLEKHPKIIEGAIEMLRKFGSQLSMSRVFIRPTYIQELEEHISQIFKGHKAICFTSTSNAHLSVIGNLIKPDDMIILDQQVHYSVQYPCKNTKLQGTEVQMVRHSDYEGLDKLIAENANKYNRIWYMADGVYSMYGDLPDTEKLKALMNKHPKLHLYFDDAHGMGWDGTNGAGYIFDKMGVSDRIVLISTLAKGFGCVGGTAIFANHETYRKNDIYGGILTYTHPLSPANVGAALASAKIHLSNEIYQYQHELKDLMGHMNKRIKEKNLTNISSPDSPIYFIGGGQIKVTTNLVKRILNEGIYVNTATFPVVPNDRSGLRFTLTRHNTKSDINLLADAIAFHFPKAVEEENDQMERVYKKFKIEYTNASITETRQSSLVLEKYKSIQEINQDLWDSMMKDRGNVSHSGLKCMEEIFSENEEPENNWSFHYPIIKDKKGNVVCTTFFTGALYKDDMLALENVSKKIEEIRKTNPYYLCSKTLAQGSMFSEGNFLFLDTNHPQWKEAIDVLLKYVEEIKKEINATVVVFRDYEDNSAINGILENEGYAKLRMPNSNKIRNPFWNSSDELLSMIESSRKRKNIRQYALRYEDQFEIEIKKTINEEEANHYFHLFSNIKDHNFSFNFFKYPKKITSILSKHSDYEFIELRIKGEKKAACAIWSYVGENHYSPLIMGLDYSYSDSHHIYQQAVYQTVKRGNDLRKKDVYLGFSADFEKQKYLAQPVNTFAFIKVDDTYNLELIESFSNV
ncbi:MAG: aminotransferase class I/II-fold pyridoxal phosphate-dependent enzyme [Bacteroidetes bacterium]|nr:aminotransferase class I/II-fold pyridoxal phosphate-dependent enzyme [Bacteroidota bacterium]